MQHHLPIANLGAHGEAMAEAVRSCVHCGFCLPACPTYREMGSEPDSPRGRIYLMKEALEGNVGMNDVLEHIDRCMGCLGCETACPSGVQYRDLISPFREMAERERPRGAMARLRHAMVMETLPYPRRFRWAARLGRLAKTFRAITPKTFRPMLDLLPDKLPPAVRLPVRTEAVGVRKARVALLAGCAQQVLSPGINRATIEVLSKNGVEVLVPEAQGCCGALAWHIGDGDRARALAGKNLSAFPEDVDAVVTNAAGCGSGLHDYPQMFAGTEHEAKARALAERAVDVSVFLDQLGVMPMALSAPTRVAYHDACHLAHAQGVRRPPRALLASVGNLELIEVPSGDICCGSAGTYNIDQPEMARALGRQKAEVIASTGAAVLTAGNIGCLVQIQTHLKAMGHPVRVLHTMELLAEACVTAAR